jgi:3-methyladenine DNA glycosylase AlkD
MTAAARQIVDELKSLGSPGIKKVLLNHGIREPLFGVKVGDMKPIQKRIKKDYQLALDLYDTGIYDAMYFAGLIADDAKMTKKDLNRWAEKSIGGGSLAGCTVPWVAVGGPHGYELALKWIESKKQHVAVAGWSTLACLASCRDDAELDVPALKKLLERVAKSIHQAPNDVRYAMNTFVIALGTYVRPLAEPALKTAGKIGRVTVDMGDTACRVPYAPDYIRKSRKGAPVAAKRKTVKC